MLYLVKTLVQYCKVRDLAWDPLKDVVFLCQHYSEEVLSVRGQLDQRATQQILLSTPSFSCLSLEDQRRCYQILLGIEPPPTMSITPAPPFPDHERSISAPETLTKGRPFTQDRQPSQAQRSPELLSPPPSGRPNASHKRVSAGAVRPSELPSSPNSQVKTPSQLSASPRDSRAKRYRAVSTSQASSPPFYQPEQSPSLYSNAEQQPQFRTAQQGTFYQSQTLQDQLTISTGSQDQERMPTKRAEVPRPCPPSQSALIPAVNGSSQSHPRVRKYASPADLAASSIALSPRQQYLKLQAGLDGGHPLRQHPVNGSQATTTPPFSQASAFQVQSPARAELPGIPLLEKGAKQYRVVNPNVPRSTSPSLETPKLEPGIPIPQSRGQSTFISPSTLPHSFIDSDAVSQLGHFIAELSIEGSTATCERHNENLTHRPDHLQLEKQTSTHADISLIQSSPIDPYDSESLSVSTETQLQNISIRPLQPHTISAPLGTLPPSLMAGHPAPRQNSPSTNNTPLNPSQPAMANTNASRYSRYYVSTPPSSKPNSPQPSPYKAYQPPNFSPPMPVSLPPALPFASPLMPLSPPPIPDSPFVSSAKSPRRTSFVALKDVDGASGYFKHRRDKSNDSCASHDSDKLAMEYQAELPSFGEGYGSPSKVGK